MHYFISDTHYTHTGAALHHSARPFANIDEHDRELIDAWNSVVTTSDTVWHLGDFASDRPDPKAVRRIFSQLRGSKHLILGNHDTSSAVRELGWSSVRDYAEIEHLPPLEFADDTDLVVGLEVAPDAEAEDAWTP